MLSSVHYVETDSDNKVNREQSLKTVEQKLLGYPIIGSVQTQAGQYFEQADQVTVF